MSELLLVLTHLACVGVGGAAGWALCTRTLAVKETPDGHLALEVRHPEDDD